jgi:hypothetical protein
MTMRPLMTALDHLNRALNCESEACEMAKLGDRISAEFFRREANYHLDRAAAHEKGQANA